jgi:hypothetical protein
MSYKTTVSLESTTVERLKKQKIHRREPIEDVIKRLLDEVDKK